MATPPRVLLAKLQRRVRHRLLGIRVDRPAGPKLDPPAWIPRACDRPRGPSFAPADSVFAFGRWWPMPKDRAGSPDWTKDPITGTVWPGRRRTDRIPIRAEERPGDVKLVWEPSRFLHAFDRVHDGEEGENQVARDISSWVEQTRLNRGVHWDNGLEAALRALSWIYADAILTQRGNARWLQVRLGVLTALRHHAEFIEATIDPGEYNHLVGDALGLLAIGASYPGMKGAQGWLERGRDVLRGEVSRQVLRDGGHAERAPAYARFVADIYLVASLVLRPIDVHESEALARVSRSILENLLLQAGPSGTLPGYGDDDGAQVLWPCEPESRLAISAGLVGARLDWSEGLRSVGTDSSHARVQEIASRLLPAEEAKRIDHRTRGAGERVGQESVVLEETGVVVGRTPSSWALSRCGSAGVGRGGHAHMDQLSVLWESTSGWSLVDPGTPTYNASDVIREESTSTRAHNSVSIDGHSQAERTGRFAWNRLPCAMLGEAADHPWGWEAEGVVTYSTASGQVRHKRRVALRDTALVLRDSIEIPGEHRASARLLVHAGQRAAPAWNGRLGCAAADGLPPLLISKDGWSAIRAESATYSPIYASHEAVLGIVVEATFRDAFSATIEFRPLTEDA